MVLDSLSSSVDSKCLVFHRSVKVHDLALWVPWAAAFVLTRRAPMVHSALRPLHVELLIATNAATASTTGPDATLSVRIWDFLSFGFSEGRSPPMLAPTNIVLNIVA